MNSVFEVNDLGDRGYSGKVRKSWEKVSPAFLLGEAGLGWASDRDRIQTCNRLIRSQLLYSIELRDRSLGILRMQIYDFCENWQGLRRIFFAIAVNLRVG